MFGTVMADFSHMEEERQQRYKACYCGLCRTLQKEYGLIPRLTLNYDMTFLILLLSSLYEPEENSEKKRCPVHPAKSRDSWTTSYTSYAAAMNVALAYYKAMDDWQDERNLLRRIFAGLLAPKLKQIQNKYPRQCSAMKEGLARLSQLEKQNILDPDAAAAAFGRITGECFVPNPEDFWANSLRQLGDNLGRFIYLSDALLDLDEDRKHRRYNPLLSLVSQGEEDSLLPALNLTIGDCASQLERLPLVQDLDILRNIIYSGVWIPYTAHQEKKGRDTRV